MRQNLRIDFGQLSEIVGPEDFFGAQRTGGDALRENGIDTARLALGDGIANVELSVFQQRDETAAIAEKIGGTDNEGLQKMFEIAAGA